MQQLTAAVLCHEIAHVAESKPDLSEPTAERREFAHAVAAYSLVISNGSDWPPFLGHGPHFVRNAIHLAYRAAVIGIDFPIHFLFSEEQYSVPSAAEFQFVLDTEPQCLADVPIFDVRKYRPRLNYMQLWKQTVERWIDDKKPTSDMARVARKMISFEQMS
jgi:hypothetical protein